MDLHRQDFVAFRIAAAFLPCPRRSSDDCIDDLEMRRVERQGHVDVARGRLEVRRESLVVLHVPRTAQFREVVVAFEFLEQVLGRLSEQVHQHVQSAAMRHADNRFLDPRVAAVLHQVIKQRNEAVAPLQRETLLTDVFGVKIALETLRGSQLPQNISLLIDREPPLHALRLKVVLQPDALFAIGHVRELGADGVAINELQGTENVLQLAAAGDRGIAAVGEEFGFQIRIGQSEILEIEHVGLGALLKAQRV